MAQVPRSPGWRHSFAAKAAAMALLLIAADILFYHHPAAGTALGGFALLWTLLLGLAVRPVRASGAARIAIALAALYALTLAERPTLLGWTLFWVAISTAALLPRRRFDNLLDWTLRLVMHVLTGMLRPVGDLRRLALTRSPAQRTPITALLKTLALPVAGGALFLGLFAGANPLIGDVLASVEMPSGADWVLRPLFWALLVFAIWPTFRPHPAATRAAFGADEPVRLPLLPPAIASSITLSLITFNAIFALQNALDLIFLWSGARLPGTITMADYAHRGAYTLIGTALLSGLFVLLFLRPGSAEARKPMVRGLLVLWIAQNLLLVGSSAHRTIDYIESYSLTELRIAALAWMALVGCGLVFVCWRLLAERSTSWLVNMNAVAAAVVLTAGCVVDLGAVAASWNVRHARSVGTGGNQLDLCYLRGLSTSALLPMIELEQRAVGERLQDRVAFIRAEMMDDLAWQQSDWHSWTWRSARRLAAAQAALGPNPRIPAVAPHGRECDGTPLPPPVMENGPTEPPASVVATNAAEPPANASAPSTPAPSNSTPLTRETER